MLKNQTAVENTIDVNLRTEISVDLQELTVKFKTISSFLINLDNAIR